MLVTVFAATPAMAKSKSKSGPKFVKSVLRYNYNSDTKKWKLDYRTNYTYNKQNDPQKVSTLNFGSESKKDYTNKFKYKKKTKRVQMKSFNSVNRYWQLTKYNANGKAVKVNSWNRDKDDKYYRTFAYDKAGFVKKYTYKNVYTYMSRGKKKTSTSTSENTYKNSYKKGLPSKTVATYKNGNEPSKTVYTTTYNAKGLPVKMTSQSENEKPTTNYTFKYKFSKGRVVSAIEYSHNNDGKIIPIEKYVFKYTKANTNKKNYASMINSMLNISTYCGYFCWY